LPTVNRSYIQEWNHPGMILATMKNYASLCGQVSEMLYSRITCQGLGSTFQASPF
jgi:hypothetical protein